MKIAEITVSLVTSGVVTEYMTVKSEKKLWKKLQNMMAEGSLDFGPVLIDMAAVETIAVKWHEVH